MKVFLTFLALLLVYVSLLTFRTDLDSFYQAQSWTKTVAEDCAAGAALYYQEESMGNGLWICEATEAMEHINYILNFQKNNHKFYSDGKIDYEIRFYDDDLTCDVYRNGAYQSSISFQYPVRFHDSKGYEIQVSEPSVIVTLSITSKHFFRLPFLRQPDITRSTMYELNSSSSILQNAG